MELDNYKRGFLSNVEGIFLTELSRRCKSDCIVNIGCYYGKSCDYILQGKSDTTHAYFIDLEITSDVAKMASDTVIVIRGNSHDPKVKDIVPLIEFLFIDGDHSYEGVKRDILMWYDKVVPGGVIVFHDAYPDNNFDVWPGVLQAIIHYVINPKYGELKTDGFLFNSPIHRIDTMFMIQKIV
jgi:predicted O-methyltransferase YrrM